MSNTDTLNEDIFGIIYDNTTKANSATPFDVFNWKNATKELEKLFLQSQIDLLNSIVAKPHFHENEGVEIYINGLGIENVIEDLTLQLNNLNK